MITKRHEFGQDCRVSDLMLAAYKRANSRELKQFAAFPPIQTAKGQLPFI